VSDADAPIQSYRRANVHSNHLSVIDRQELLRKVARLEAELVAEREALARAVRQLSRLPSSAAIASTSTDGAAAVTAPTSALPPRLNAPNDSSADETRTESSGTLVQAAGGQYKFIGPSAGPPWLREVSRLPCPSH
jgi:hypothetical protein